jgi:hypothetical protein
MNSRRRDMNSQTETKRADTLRPGDYIIHDLVDGEGLVGKSYKHPIKGRWVIELAGPFAHGVAAISFSFPKNHMITVTNPTHQ